MGLGKQSRGYRNKNPGNIRQGINWHGLAPVQKDPVFATFSNHEFGIRALVKNLLTYQSKHNLNTIAGIIERWAPPNENDTNNYIRNVAKWTAILPNEELDLKKYEDIRAITKGIIRMELGAKNVYDDAIIDEGLSLAGIDIPHNAKIERPMEKQKSRNNQQRGIIGITTLGIAAQATNHLTSIYDDILSIGAIAGSVLALIMVAYLFREDIKEFTLSQFRDK